MLIRFKHDYFASKLSDVVQFPLDNFDISPFTEQELRTSGANQNCNKDDYLYDLVGIVNHSGSAYGGHYVAYTRDIESNKWFLCNDRFVSNFDILSHDNP